jgi:hypothetical protein
MAIRYLSGVNIDSNTLVVDDANNRVGIGTASPTYTFDIVNTSSPTFRITRSGATDFRIGASILSSGALLGTYSNSPIQFLTNSNVQAVITEAGNVGIGTTSPGYKLHVDNNATGYIVRIQGDTNNISFYDGGSGGIGIGTDANQDLKLYTNDSLNNGLIIKSSGNVGIGTTSPSSKLQVNGTVVANAAFADSNAERIIKPNGGFSVGTTPSLTGAIKITYPVGFTNTMHRVKVNVYEYSTNESFTIYFGGYNYSPDSSWYNEFAYTINNPGVDRNFAVRFGYDGTKMVVYIGELNSTWSYPQVFIEEVELGFGGQSTTWRDGAWAISYESSAFQNVTKTVSNPQATNWVRNGGNVYYSLGNVGIGTTSPASKLQINVGTDQNVAFNSTGGVSRISAYDDAVANSVPLIINGSDLRFTNNTTEAVRITSGNVGIGTTSPSQKLDVAGNININSVSYTYKINGFDTISASSTYTNIHNPEGAISIYLGDSADRTNYYDNNAHRFRSAGGGTTYAAITSAGNVGIGTTSPASILHVVKNDSTQDPLSITNTASIIIQNTYGSLANTGPALFFESDSGTYNTFAGIAGNMAGSNATGSWGHLTFGTKANDAATTLTERMRITNGGNVGIGTTSPGAKLEVAGGSANWNETTQGTSVGTIHLNPGVSTNDFGNAITFGASDSGGGATAQAGIYLRTDGNYGTKMYFSTTDSYAVGSKTRMFIGHNGNVGIGTTSPAQKLEVNGSVLATSLIKSGGTSSQYLMADGSVSTTSNVAPRYVQTINVSQTAYTTICTITGGSLASAVNMSFQGTSGNVVVNVTAQILVNHFQDITITTTSGFYSQLNIRVISNNDETYSVEAQVISGVGATTDLNIEVFPLNSESVTFGGSPVTPGTTLVHTTRQGLYVSASEPMSISSGSDIYAAGNVGVGTTSPSSKLHVVGDILASAASGNRSVVLTTNNANAALNTIAGSGAELATDGTNQNIAFRTGVSTRMYITSGGNVGIGTTSPGNKLQVQNGNLGLVSDAYGSTGLIRFFGTDSLEKMQIGLTSGGDSYMYTYSGNNLIFYTNAGSERLRITSGGNVGIGTTNPAQKLSVQGEIAKYTTSGFDGTFDNLIKYGYSADLQSGTAVANRWIGIDATVTAGGAVSNVLRIRAYPGTTGNAVPVNVADFRGDQSAVFYGNVGIGVTAPASKLHVWNGKVQVTGFPSSGSPFTFLQSDYNDAAVTVRFLNVNPSNGLDADLGIQLSNTSNVITDVMRIKGSTGNVGIGTTSPTHKLHVLNAGAAAIIGDGNDNYFGNYSSGDYWDIGNLGATGNVYLESRGASTNINGHYRLKGAGSHIWSYNGGSNEVMRTTSAGNVGIGTTSPQRLLSVGGAYGGTSNTESVGLFQSTGNTYITVGTGASSQGGLLFADSGSNNAGAITYSHNTDSMEFGTAGAERMRITAAGNVGIGTTSPGYKLDVSGTLRTTSEAVLGYNTTVGNVSFAWGFPGTYFGQMQNVSGTVYGLGFGSGTTSIGTTVMSYNTAGNVGIGTTSPGARLQVSGGRSWFFSGDNYSIGLAQTAAQGNYMYLGTASDGTFYISETGGTARVTVQQGGNVGIGTTSPTQGLHVSSAVGSANTGITIQNTSTGNPQLRFLNSSGTEVLAMTYISGTTSSLYIYTAAAGNLLNLVGANVGIGTTSPESVLHVAQTSSGGKVSLYVDNNASSALNNEAAIKFSVDAGASVSNGGAEISAINVNAGNGNTDLTFKTFNASVGFTEKMRITASGNVGIGTTSPVSPLDVNGIISSRNIYIAQNSGTYNLIYNASNSVAMYLGGSADPGNYYDNTTHYFRSAGGGTTYAIINSSGNVGIGTTSPGARLSIQNSGTTDSIISEYRMTNGSNAATFRTDDNVTFGIHSQNSGDIYIKDTSDNVLFYGKNGGNVGIGTTSPNDGKLQVFSNSSSHWGIYAFNQNTNGIGLHVETNSYGTEQLLRLSSLSGAGGTNTVKMVVRADGNVGIGTTSPTEKLHVDGNVIVTYNNSFQGINSIGNKAILARVSPTTGIINYAEYATATNLNGFVLGSDDARIKGDIATDSLDFITNTSSRMFINSSGNVGIATTSPSYKLDVVGDSRITSGSLGVGVTPNATDGRIDASNDIVAYSTSDQRLKENVTPIENALEKVKTLTGVEFDWKEETAHIHGYHGHDVGIIAQDVQAVLPEAVRTNESGYLSVRYEKMIALLIEANKELAARVEELEKKLK